MHWRRVQAPRHATLAIEDLDRAARSRDPEDRIRAASRRCERRGSSVDPWYLPALMDLLRRRTEPEVRISVIRALGRIRDQSVFPAIIECLGDPALRVHAIEALADQGDERARAHLLPLVEDQTERDWDDRGAPIRIGALASTAIRRFDEPDVDRHYGQATFRPFHDAGWGDPVPPMLAEPLRLGEDTPLRTNVLHVLAMIPGSMGFVAAIVILLHYRLRAFEHLALIVGALACVLRVVFATDW